MTEQRIPKTGEVWKSTSGTTRTVVNVYPDAVTYTYCGDRAGFAALTLDDFVGSFAPPEPKVVDSLGLYDINNTIGFSAQKVYTYRVDLYDDGTMKLVAL